MSKLTKPGLLLVIMGSLIGLISNIVFSLSQEANLFFSAISGIGGLLSLIGILLIIIGGKEFGERHKKFTIYALILFIMSVIIPVIVVAGIVFTFISTMSNGGDFNAIQNIFYIIPLASIIGGLAYILLLYELENKIGRYVLYSTFVVTIVVSVVLSLNIGTVWNETLANTDFENISPTDPEFTENMDEFTQRISLTGLYSIPNSILMLIALIIPYKRITSGELVPITAGSSKSSKCPNCGWDISPGTNECPHCNFKINF